MDTERAFYYIAFLVLLSLTAYGYNRHNKLVEEFEEETIISSFLQNEQLQYQQQSQDDEILFLNFITQSKKDISDRLCVLKNIIESSISVAQISLPETDNEYKYDISGLGMEDDIGGKYVDEFVNQGAILNFDGSENKCNHKTWLPDEIKKKESIVGYTSKLVRYYNKKVLDLNNKRVVLSEFIDEFQRLLVENLDEKLLGRCDVCTTEDCNTVLCVNTSENTSIRLLNSKKLIISKVETLQSLLCEFANLYKHLGDIQKVIIAYTNELQSILNAKKHAIGGHMTLNLLRDNGYPLRVDESTVKGVSVNNRVLDVRNARDEYRDSRRNFVSPFKIPNVSRIL
jgi:hypothetical protein